MSERDEFFDYAVRRSQQLAGDVKRNNALMASVSLWRPIDLATLPKEQDIMVAASNAGEWFVGQAILGYYGLYWVKDECDYTLAVQGHVPRYWQPMPAPPEEKA